MPLRKGIELIHLGEFRTCLDVLILLQKAFTEEELCPGTGVITNTIFHSLRIGCHCFIIFFLIMQ